MAITFDAVSSSAISGTSSLAWSHTITSASGNRALVVGVSSRGSLSSVSSVQWAGTLLTQQASITNSNVVSAYLYWLQNPAAGSSSIVVTAAGAASARYLVGGATSWANVSASGVSAGATGGTSNPKVDVTSVVNDIVVDSVSRRDAAGAEMTADAPQTERWSKSAGSTSLGAKGGGSTVSATATTTTMSWTSAAVENWAMVGFTLQPLGDGIVVVPVPTKMLIGVGL